MRSLFARLALAGTVGVALAGCGTQSGSSLPVGGPPNNSGGGTVNVSNQPPVGGSVPGALIDGGTVAFTGFNTTATDTLAATPAQPTDAATAGSGPPPADVAGSHSIAYSGNAKTQQLFAYPTAVNLTIPTKYFAPGAIQPVDYGAIVFSATLPASAASLSIELTGGSGATLYDVRIACTGAAATTGSTLATRYVCPLPAYGTASSPNIVNAALDPNATGSFTPFAAKLYIVVNDEAPLATTAADVLALDYIYAEQGAK